jgi:hypothetical protein
VFFLISGEEMLLAVGLVYILIGMMLCKKMGIVVKMRAAILFCFLPLFFYIIGGGYSLILNEFNLFKFSTILLALTFLIFSFTSNIIKYNLWFINFSKDDLYDSIFAVFNQLEFEYDIKHEKRYSKLIFRNFDASVIMLHDKRGSGCTLRFIKPKNIPTLNNLIVELQRSMHGREFKGTPTIGILVIITGLQFTIFGLLGLSQHI